MERWNWQPPPFDAGALVNGLARMLLKEKEPQSDGGRRAFLGTFHADGRLDLGVEIATEG